MRQDIRTVTLPYTFVVVDNGSTDGTRECLEYFRETAAAAGVGFTLVPDGANVGCSTARNQGIERSRGERIVFIDNPKSGGGTYAAYADWAQHLYALLGYEVTLWRTERPGHATELARRAGAAGATLVVACSGDGGVRETGAGLVSLPAERRPKLSGLPKGTANVLAKTVGLQVGPIPDFLHACFRQLYWAQSRVFDVAPKARDNHR